MKIGSSIEREEEEEAAYMVWSETGSSATAMCYGLGKFVYEKGHYYNLKHNSPRLHY